MRRSEDVLPRVVLGGMIAVYVFVFGQLTWAQHANFGTFGFDMGIYDQGIWLVSRGHDPFVTVRGLHYFGHHANLSTLLFVPAYWLGAGPIFLYLVETVALALGAIPLWLLARDRWDHPWLALTAPAAFLLYPSTEWITWWHFHPDALIVTPLLFAWWFASRGRWGGFWIAVSLALAAKEDAAMAIFMLGLVIAYRWDRRRGLITASVAAVWFVAATWLLIPALTNGEGPFYNNFFSDFGSGSMAAVVWEMVTHPLDVVQMLFAPSRIDYYRQMGAPVAFLALASPAGLLVGLPQFAVNALSSHDPLRDIRFHYSAVPTAAMFIASVEGVARLAAGRLPALRFLAGLMIAVALATNVAWSPSPTSVKFRTGIWVRTAPHQAEAINTALDSVPEDAGVVATYDLVPHLTHRRHIYEWPNPFQSSNWGIDGGRPHPVENADYLVLDTAKVADQELFEHLIEDDYRVVSDSEGIVVAERRDVGGRATTGR